MRHEINRDGMAEKIESLQTARQGLVEAGMDFERAVNLLTVRWSGEAQQGFAEAYEAWRVDFSNLTGFLARVIAASWNAHERYRVAKENIDGHQ